MRPYTQQIICYKTNFSSEHRTPADNVSTQQNKVLIAPAYIWTIIGI